LHELAASVGVVFVVVFFLVKYSHFGGSRTRMLSLGVNQFGNGCNTSRILTSGIGLRSSSKWGDKFVAVTMSKHGGIYLFTYPYLLLLHGHVIFIHASWFLGFQFRVNFSR